MIWMLPRCRNNDLSRPKDFLASSPDEAFRHVRPITQTTWDSFAQAVENFKVEARKRLGLLEKLVEQDALSRSDRNVPVAHGARLGPRGPRLLIGQEEAIFSTFSTPFFVILFPGGTSVAAEPVGTWTPRNGRYIRTIMPYEP
jgi:hypothetical protein